MFIDYLVVFILIDIKVGDDVLNVRWFVFEDLDEFEIWFEICWIIFVVKVLIGKDVLYEWIGQLYYWLFFDFVRMGNEIVCVG